MVEVVETIVIASADSDLDDDGTASELAMLLETGDEFDDEMMMGILTLVVF